MSEPISFPLRKAVLVELEIGLDDVLRSLSDDQLLAECAQRGIVPRPAEDLSGECIRGARGLLDWSLERLAAASGVSVSTIKRLEDSGPGHTRPGNVEAVRCALQGAGVQFLTVAGGLGIHRAAAPLPARLT